MVVAVVVAAAYGCSSCPWAVLYSGLEVVWPCGCCVLDGLWASSVQSIPD